MTDNNETYSTYSFGYTDNEGKEATMIMGGPDYVVWVQLMDSFIDFLEATGFIGVRERLALTANSPSADKWRGPTFTPEDSR